MYGKIKEHLQNELAEIKAAGLTRQSVSSSHHSVPRFRLQASQY